jgi:hypothetical protein
MKGLGHRPQFDLFYTRLSGGSGRPETKTPRKEVEAALAKAGLTSDEATAKNIGTGIPYESASRTFGIISSIPGPAILPQRAVWTVSRRRRDGKFEREPAMICPGNKAAPSPRRPSTSGSCSRRLYRASPPHEASRRARDPASPAKASASRQNCRPAVVSSAGLS